MGHKHSKTELLAGALDVAFADGLSKLSFGRVARHLGISDRTVVYYFPTKDDLVSEVLVALGAELRVTLEAAFTEPASDRIALAAAAWPVLTTSEAEPVFALFFEAMGLAAAGQEPYRTLAPMLITGWIDWAASLLDVPVEQRRDEAEAAIAMIDGVLLLRHLVGAEASDRAAARLGLTPS